MGRWVACLDAPIVHVPDACRALGKQRCNRQGHGCIRDVIAVVVHTLQLAARRPCVQRRASCVLGAWPGMLQALTMMACSYVTCIIWQRMCASVVVLSARAASTFKPWRSRKSTGQGGACAAGRQI